VDRRRHSKSFFGPLDLADGTMKVYPIDGRQNTEQTIFALARLQRETSQEKIAVVLDNANFHRSEELMAFLEPGNGLERTTLEYLPPYAPDHNPVEHVWNAAKGHIANYQRHEPEHTYSAFMSTSPAGSSTTTSSTCRSRRQNPILFHDSHVSRRVCAG